MRWNPYKSFKLVSYCALYDGLCCNLRQDQLGYITVTPGLDSSIIVSNTKKKKKKNHRGYPLLASFE